MAVFPLDRNHTERGPRILAHDGAHVGVDGDCLGLRFGGLGLHLHHRLLGHGHRGGRLVHLIFSRRFLGLEHKSIGFHIDLALGWFVGVSPAPGEVRDGVEGAVGGGDHHEGGEHGEAEDQAGPHYQDQPAGNHIGHGAHICPSLSLSSKHAPHGGDRRLAKGAP